MRLKYLTLKKLTDVAYFCGMDGNPVSIMIAAPPGSGKTWSAKSLQDVDFVQYLNHVYSPNEHRQVVAKKAARTRLIINDDLGLAARWNQKEFYSTFIMMCDGEISFTQWRQNQHANLNSSLVLLCTLEYFTANSGDMRGMGLLDRLVPVVVGLSQETRRNYQDHIRENHGKREIPPRFPDILIKHEYQDDLIAEKDIEPRLLQNLSTMSQYLSPEEFSELIAVAHSEDKYEV